MNKLSVSRRRYLPTQICTTHRKAENSRFLFIFQKNSCQGASPTGWGKQREENRNFMLKDLDIFSSVGKGIDQASGRATSQRNLVVMADWSFEIGNSDQKAIIITLQIQQNIIEY